MYEYGERLYVNDWIHMRGRRQITFRFRIDPVPYTGRHRFKMRRLFRHPRMVRQTVIEEVYYEKFFRKRRSRKCEAWDDYPAHFEKSWKWQRKVRHQWER